MASFSTYYPFLMILAFSSFVLGASPELWQKRSIYQLITDRFANSDNSSAPCVTSARKYCGGSWKGITTHLDYIQALGFDAVWISPIGANIENETPYGEAYHGYWTTDIYGLNTHYGTASDLTELSQALHSRGMYLMIDIVVNHFAIEPLQDGSESQLQTFNFSSLSPFSSQSDYHSRCAITDYNNQTQSELCWLGDKLLPLADLDTENPSIVNTMNDWINALVKTHGADGIRIDTVKHIRKDFWPGFVKSSGTFTLGEIFTDSTTYAAGYTDVIDSILDYPTWYPLTAAFSSPLGNFSALVETTVTTQTTYKNGAFMTGSFLENHDQPRFQSKTQDQALVKNAMTWPFVHDGIPITYYGQEQGYTGSGDPNCREALWFTSYSTEKPLVSHVKSLNAARKMAIKANAKFLTTPMTFIPQSNNATLAISKPPILALLTNIGNRSTSPTSWTIPSGLFKRGENVVDVLRCRTVQVNSDGSLEVQVNSGMPQVLMPASVLSKNGALCPSTASGNGGTHNNKASWAMLGSAIAVAFARAFF